MIPPLAFKWGPGPYCKIGKTWIRWMSMYGESLPLPSCFVVREGQFYLA
jgi:hypothetical protein